jgi:hypothetical protein
MTAAPLTLFKLARFAPGLSTALVALAALATVAGAARAAADFFAFTTLLAALATGTTDVLLTEIADLAPVSLLVGFTEPVPAVPLCAAFFFPLAVPPAVFAIANLACQKTNCLEPFIIARLC